MNENQEPNNISIKEEKILLMIKSIKNITRDYLKFLHSQSLNNSIDLLSHLIPDIALVAKLAMI
jgi:hypothetical protein